jgi:pyruvate/2-oxoglutarate dehydrogenase complex dihydrolipoamide acyltransferase (E2) component
MLIGTLDETETCSLVHFAPQGTIVEWTAAVGQAVKEGDVVALVETDKVTVDIKAEMDGVIVKQFGAV